MRVLPDAFSAFLIAVGAASAFSRTGQLAFAPRKSLARVNPFSAVVSSATSHSSGCRCQSCTGSASHPARHTSASGRTALFADVVSETETETKTDESAAEAAAEDVPAEVEALDGIESPDEAHNTKRPARKSLHKKGPRGKPLSEFAVGDSVEGKVKSIASYGAFVDFGGQTDGLLHISQLSTEYVADVGEILQVGQEIDVRIVKIDEAKGQVGLTFLTQEQEDAAAKPRQREQRRAGSRRDDSAVAKRVVEKGWDSEQFVEGTVVSVVDFGAFVRIDVSQLNAELEGEMDGLVHISSLSTGRVNSVSSVVNENDKVQVRVKAIADRKVSLSMVSTEDEQAKAQSSGRGGSFEGAKDWKESLEKIQGSMPAFQNSPLVVDLRK